MHTPTKPSYQIGLAVTYAVMSWCGSTVAVSSVEKQVLLKTSSNSAENATLPYEQHQVNLDPKWTIWTIEWERD